MSNPEFRVRPVIRHVVTRYTEQPSLPPGVHTDAPRASLETLGEFDSEGYAEIVAEALAEKAAPREYVIVQCKRGEVQAKVFHASDEEQARRWMAEPAAEGESYQVYSRIKPRP